MSSIGVFREGEIDGKPFHIYTSQSQTDIPTSSSSSGVAAIDSGGDANLSLQPFFLCPTTRREIDNLTRGENGCATDDDYVLAFSTSPHYPNITSCEQQVQDFFDPESHPHTCKFPLFQSSDNSDNSDDDDDNSSNNYCEACSNNYCEACEQSEIGSHSYYVCTTCHEMFHKECVEAPLEIKHPSYPFLSLQLYSFSKTFDDWLCTSCGYTLYNIVYTCPTYKLKLHPVCAMQPIPLFINHLKRHPHSLTFFPKQNFLPCNVCGDINDLIPTYVCSRCVFVVHQDCVSFPYVIRISRHEHRISFTYSLPSGELSCGVCRKKVNNDCGAYSCNKCAGYFIHSRCALRGDLWDGKELEGVPEDPEIVVEPFKTIADGIILHFSHGHHLKLAISILYDDEKFCQACMLPIYEGYYYSCMEHCDFILHEACANSPLRKHHPLNALPLSLKVVTNGYDHSKGRFNCDACRRESCGFVYGDRKSFKLDVRCASISEPFKYEGHKHPLFLALTPEEEKSAICQICKDTGSTGYCRRKLNCIECDYVICFHCATLPYKAMYKHDKHLLTFREGKEASERSGWCEVCERRIVYSRVKGFYSCDDYCCTTLHVYCLLGTDPYMKPGQTISIYDDKAHILRNNTMVRPFCQRSGPQGKCGVGRCPYKMVFERRNKTFCSLVCAIKSTHRGDLSGGY